MTKLPWGACSGDESEGGESEEDKSEVDESEGDESDESEGDASNKKLVITKLPWRAHGIRAWMQTLDNLDLVHRFEDGVRSTPGNFPRPRSDPQLEDPPRVVVETRRHRPVKGLPRNFYDSKWLGKLPEYEVDRLSIQPPIDLTFPPGIARCVIRYLPSVIFTHWHEL